MGICPSRRERASTVDHLVNAYGLVVVAVVVANYVRVSRSQPKD